MADWLLKEWEERGKEIADLRAQLEQAQGEWIESAGHRPGCAALRCIEWHVEVGGLCGTLKENHEMHLWHEFQPGPCDCGYAEQVGG